MYAYHCSIHQDMLARVDVGMKVTPDTGTTVTTFTTVWARGRIPSGFTAKVQVSRPGGPGFVGWLDKLTGTITQGEFVPDAGPGVYASRTRLHSKANGASTGWSRGVTIVVS